jgi:tRNA threonylcarbamoyl adenosine modification protein (Sua5/YciO/YrdC/YwlC family)
MAAEYFKLFEQNPEQKKILRIVDILRKDGIIIYPTDTVYGLGCDIFNQKAIERLCRLKGINTKKSNLSFVCYDLSDLSNYARGITTPIFKLMKKALPGPYTFVLKAGSNVPKLFQSNKKTVGIRVPDNNIARQIVKELGNPIVSTSIKDEDELVEYTTDPELIYEKFKDTVNAVIDGGHGGNIASTVVDCSGDSYEIIREGKGDLSQFMLVS